MIHSSNSKILLVISLFGGEKLAVESPPIYYRLGRIDDVKERLSGVELVL
jgi:hypothetical protein